MEVCQPGKEGVLPAWCIEYEFGLMQGLQLIIELILLTLLFFVALSFFKWRKRRKLYKLMLKRKQEETEAKIQIRDCK